MMANTMKVIAACLILSVSMQMCHGSAIPIWEFLTRNEKIGYLYSTFAQLVSVHCKATSTTSSIPVNQCKRNLLGYGYEKLQTFSDAQLDALDPYQRGANELIWSSIMRDHASSTLITTRKPLPTPPASSIIILTHQKPTKASTPTPNSSQQFPKNPLFDGEQEHKHQYAMDMDSAYGYAGQGVQQQPSSTTQQQPKTYLTGPLVFRVRPDGTPVEEDKYKPLPRDDDLEGFQLSSGISRSSTIASFGNGGSATSQSAANRPRHRKIATISALKQQHLATLSGLQQQLQPPFENPRLRRQFQLANQQPSTFAGYFYGKGQA